MAPVKKNTDLETKTQKKNRESYKILDILTRSLSLLRFYYFSRQILTRSISPSWRFHIITHSISCHINHSSQKEGWRNSSIDSLATLQTCKTEPKASKKPRQTTRAKSQVQRRGSRSSDALQQRIQQCSPTNWPTRTLCSRAYLRC